MRKHFFLTTRCVSIALIGVALATLLSGCVPPIPNNQTLTSADAGTPRTPYVSTAPALLCRGCELH